jgi:hypothetical protein
MPEREELDLDCAEERTVRNFLGHKFWQGNRLAAPTNNHSAGAENSRAQEGCRIPQKNSEHLTHAARDHEKAAKDNEIGCHEAAVHDAQTASGHTNSC